MRKTFKWAFRALLLLALVLGGVAIWKREQISRLLAVNTLFAADRIVQNFSNMDDLFLSRVIDLPDGPPSPLPVMPMALPDISDWVEARAVTALVVLKDGNLVFEDYYLGTSGSDLRISWSVAKSFLSALMGVVLAEGNIASIDDQVTRYVPALKGSAYEGASIRNVLNMASGVRFNEDYLDFNSDINKMGRVLALGGSMDGFAAGLSERAREPGVAWQYVSIDTHVLGMVIRGATGRSIPDLMGEKLLAPLGLEADPIMLTDGDGVAFVLGGLNLRSRDYARLGQLYLQNGQWNGVQIVPGDWVEASTVSSAPGLPDYTGYGFQWWLPADAAPGEFYARGIYGQYIYINRPAGVVIALGSADLLFDEAGTNEENITMFRKITAALGG